MGKEDMERFRVLASEQRFRAALRWLADYDHRGWPEVLDFISSFCLPTRQGGNFESLIRFVRKCQAMGLEPKNVPTLAEVLRDEMAKKWNTLDPLSIVGASVPPLDEGESFPWSLLSRDYYLAPFFNDHLSGGVLTVTGLPRMGKTGVACLYGEMWLEAYPGTEILTNIPMENCMKGVQGVCPVSTIIALLEGIARALEAERRWLWIFDEPALSGWMKADAATGRSKNLERFARIVPKLSGSFIYIEQRVEGVPSVIQDFAQSHILCTTPGFVLADLPARHTAIRAVPKPSRIRYRTGEAGYFDIPADFPWDGLFRALRYNPDLNMIEEAKPITQGERIVRFLDSIKDAEPVPARPAVSCVWCGESWIPRKDGPPDRCPRCLRRHPLGGEGELPLPSQIVPG